MRAVIYARYSSDKQRAESVTAQIRFCQNYADNNNLQIVGIYKDEAISGKNSKTTKRLQYQKMLRDAKKGEFDTILIHKYDRVARSVQEHVNLAAKLSEYNIDIVAVDQDFGQSKEAKLMKVLMWALSEFYIDNLSDEVKKGHYENAVQGLHNGGYAPFGYDVIDKKYVINNLEAVYVRKMFDVCISGEKYNDLIEEMNKAGIKGKRGQPITYSSIYEILRNEKYTGVYLYTPTENKKRDNRRSKENSVRIEDAFPAIISKEIWEEVQKIMNTNKNNGCKAKHNYLASGLVVCECGANMHAFTTNRKKNGNTYSYSYYSCSAKCGSKNIKADMVDECIFNYLAELLTEDNKNVLEKTLAKYKDNINDIMACNKSAIKKDIADKQCQVDTMIKNLSASVLPANVVEQIGKNIEELNEQILCLKKELEIPQTFSKPQVLKYLDTVADLKNQPFENQQAAVKHFIEKVQINKNAVNITSTFSAFLGNNGCGGAISMFPKLFFGKFFYTNHN